MKEKPYKEIVEILDEILVYLKKPSCNVIWSHFDEPEDVIKEIKRLRKKSIENDITVIPELSFLFIGTGDMQEISLYSGWGNEFLSLADRFDRSAKEILSPDKFSWEFLWLITILILSLVLVLYYLY